MTAQSKDLCIMTMFPARPVNTESPNQNHLGVFRHYAEVLSKKSGQKRLHSCVLAQPKWPKVIETLRQRVRETLKNSDFVADTVVRVENNHEKGQDRHNSTLLGKYRLNSTKILRISKQNG